MAELLLANPRRRRRAKASAKRKTPRRRRHVARRRRRAVVAVAAPHRRRKSNPHRRTHSRRKYRRNPSFRNITTGIVPTLKAGAIGAVGAVGVDLAYGYLGKYLPTSMQTGIAANAAKLLTAILVGVVGNKLLKGKGKELAVGAVTVQLHQLATTQLMAAMPSLPLGRYIGMGAYFGAGSNAMGYRNSLATPILTTGLGGLGNVRAMNAENTPGDFNDGIF